MNTQSLPPSLQNIVDLFAESPPQERLELLLDYAGRLPDLPEDLKEARAQMEPVPECQAPVYLFSRFEDGKVYYNIDVPDEAPTVRGFAGILYEGLNGLPPHSVQTTPDDLYEQMGLDKVLSPQRLRGLTALLMRMKRRARDAAA